MLMPLRALLMRLFGMFLGLLVVSGLMVHGSPEIPEEAVRLALAATSVKGPALCRAWGAGMACNVR
jgi:hypothetical protein